MEHLNQIWILNDFVNINPHRFYTKLNGKCVLLMSIGMLTLGGKSKYVFYLEFPFLYILPQTPPSGQ